MAHQSDIETEKYRQWVKAGLGLKYLQEGLAPFCNDVSKQQHRDILDNIKRVKNVPSVMCGTCTLKTLQPDHVKFRNKQCPYGQYNCNCHYTIGKCPCPNNVCGAIYDSIIHYHASWPPAPYWKNTQTQQWTADPWSISKCFINAPGYGQNTSAADTDCAGLLHMIINNKYFHNHVSCNMNGPNMFSKVRKYRNEIFNSSTRGLDSKKTNSYIDDMIAVLQDGKELIHRQDAQQAVKKLKDLKNKDLVITTVDKGLGDIGENIGSNKLAMEEHKEDSEEEQIAKYETLESKSMKTAASQVKSRNNWVHLFRLLTLTIDEGTTIVRNIFDEKRLNVPLDVFLAQHRHDNKQLRKTKTITQSQYDLLFPQIGTPATTDFDFTLTICLLRNLKPFGLNQHFAWNALPQPGDTSLEADLLRLKIIRNELTSIPASTGISEQDFKSKWSDIENVHLRLNASLQNPDVNLHQRIDECKNKPFDPGALKGIEQSIDYLQTLINSEVESLRTEIDNLTSKSDDINKEMQTLKTNQEKWKSCEETEQNHMLQQDDRNIPDAFENDPYYLQLYNDAISKGEENDRVIRVNVVGNFAQGKTTLIKRLTHQPIEGVESTNSIEISHCEYECTEDKLHFNTKEHVDNEDHFTLRVARVAVKRKEQNLRNLPQHSSLIPSVLEMKTDIENDRKTEEKNSKHQFEVKTEETIERTGTVDRNLDSPKRRTEQIREETSYVSKKFALHVQNSRHKYTHQNNLEIWDFGGQFSYYATHTLFHSRRAVYLLVFDLSIPLKKMVIDSDFPNRQDEKTMEEYAQFWLNSIDAYVGSEDGKEPPVILVGTHKDKLKGDEVVKDEEIYTYFAQIMRLFNNTTNMKCHIQPRFFSVDNNDENDHDVIELRKEVIKQGEKLANTSIPAIWIPLEKALQMKRHTKIMSFEDMMIIGNEVQLKDEEEVKLFLRYHHFKGTLLYFDEEPISAYVVLDPQYLIDAFKCIITTKRFSAQDLLDTLYEEALLENALIDCLWNNENGFSSHKKELLMFLEKHLIISEVPVFDEKCQKSHGSGKYLVPSLLPSSSTEAHLIAFLESGNQTSVRFVMSFYRSAVVQLVFYRLLAAMTGKWKIFQKPISRKPTIHKTFIYENKGVFQLDTYHAGIVEYTENEIDLRVLRLDLSDDVERKCADKFRRFSELIVKNEFMKFRNSVALNSKPYKVCLRCNDKMHGSEGSISAVPLANLGDKDMRCPDLHTHVIRPAQVLSEWFLKDEEDIDEDKSFLDRQIDDRELSEISKAIGKNWEVLGLNLGLTKVKLDHIQMDEGTTEMRIYAMLQEWKGHNKDCATIKALIHAMKNDTRVRIDWEHMRNFIDKIKSTSN